MASVINLSALDEERARRIHDESIILLAHDHRPPDDDWADLREGGITGQILLAVVDVRVFSSDPDDCERSKTQIEGWYNDARVIYQDMLAQISRHPELLTVLRADDILRAKKEGRTGIMLGAEGGKLVEYSLDNLRSLYDMGLRHILLTWAYNNQISSAELDPENRGLSEFGREVVAEMNRLGILVDITHVSRRGMQDVLDMSTKPVLNSHTTLKTISHRIPALEPHEIKALADQGGVLALHFMTHMLTGRFDPPATMDEVMRQIDEIVKIGGIECLALGPDYLVYTDEFKRNTQQHNLTFPIGLESCADMLNITRALLARGYKEDAISKILGGNLFRLMRETMDASAKPAVAATQAQ